MCQGVVDEGQEEANDGETRRARYCGSGFGFGSGMETSFVKCPSKATWSQPENEKGDEEENAETKLETHKWRRLGSRNEGKIRINSHFLEEEIRVFFLASEPKRRNS